jgi:cytoskeletal protein RodZ
MLLALIIYCGISIILGVLLWTCCVVSKMADNCTEEALQREREDK